MSININHNDNIVNNININSNHHTNNNYLSKFGYVIHKNSITIELLNTIKRELTARPLCDDKYGKINNIFPVYIETKNKIYIPKIYGISRFGLPKMSKSYIGEKWDHEIPFTGTLYENQIEPVHKLIEACKNHGGGILSLKTGGGKSISAIKVISELKMKTLIVVNKITLMKQWENELNHFLPEASIGFLQGQKNINITDCDIVLAMLQSLSRIDYPDSLFKDFGTVVVDECFIYDTYILTSIGPIKIGDLYYFDLLPHVKTINEYTGEFEWKPILNVFRKQNDQLLAITCVYNNTYHRFYCTYNHQFLTTNGWIAASDLNVNDIIVSYSMSLSCYSIISHIEYNIKNTYTNSYVYDLEIADNHNYIVYSKDHNFGMIAHNCHNTSSQMFSKIFFKICSQYTIGLSATPQRSDGCENVFKWHLGDIVYQSKNESREGLHPIIRNIVLNSKNYKEIKTINKFKCDEQIQYTSTLSELLNMTDRNKLIIFIIKSLISENLNRKILLLSDRRSHVQELKKILDSDLSITFTYGLFIGGMKISELEKNKSTQCILATYKAFAEGVSEKELNTLLLVSPKKFIDENNTSSIKKDSGILNQAVGRIFRKSHETTHPMIIDLQDNFSIFRNQNKQRNTFYKKHFPNGLFEEAHLSLDSELQSIEYKKKYNFHNNNIINDINTISNTEQTCLID